jgi:hypothetical protein
VEGGAREDEKGDDEMRCDRCCYGEMTPYWNGTDWYLACDDCGEERYPNEVELKAVLHSNPNGVRP